MKKSIYILAMAALAFAGCTLNEADKLGVDVPRVDKPMPEITYEGSGNLVTGAIGEETKLQSTYSWEAKDNAIVINVTVDLEEFIDSGEWEVGHFFLDLDSINDYLGALVTSDTDESNFYPVEPDGTQCDWTSYKPGMWVDAQGYSTDYSKGTMYWQWYIWTGRDGIYYDYGEGTDKAYNGVVIIGGNPGNVSGMAADLSGNTTTSKAKLVLSSGTYDFIVNVKYSGTVEVPDSEGYIEEYMEAANDYPYGSGVWGNHQYHWYFDSEGLHVDADIVSTTDEPVEDWGLLGIVIPPEVMTAYLGIDDINKLADLDYFYPLQADGTAYTKDGEKAWTSYAPGQWVDADGNGSNWQGIFYWQYQFGDYKYDGHFTEGLLVVGVNPGNVASVAGNSVTSKAQLGDKTMTVTANFYDSFPTSKTGTVGAHYYTWTLGDSAVDIMVNCSIAKADDSWNWFGFCINEAYINAKYGIDIDTVSADITQFYPTDAAGTAYESWSSYAPGEWFAADGSEANWSSGVAFWQYYTYQEYDYEIPNLVLIGNNPDNVASQAPGDIFVSKAKMAGNDWTVTVNILD